MKLTLNVLNKDYQIDTQQGISLAIPLYFNEEQPNTYNVPKASAKAFEGDGFVGDTRRGGGCNFEVYQFIPHCNGTHTECVGHISLQRYSIHETLKDSFALAKLISIKAEKANDTKDTYTPSKNPEDFILSQKSLAKELQDFPPSCEALIIRTLPNDESKKTRQYMENLPPFFSLEAMQFIIDLGIKHLILDIPSVDRTFDEGKLSAHRIFWEIPENEKSISNLSPKTITEMAFIPNTVKDDFYLLNLQIPAFVADASPSQPIIYPLENLEQ